VKLRPRYTPSQIKARLILIVGICISIAFVGTVGVLLYGLLFVTQPLEQAPNDAEAWKILSPLTLTMSGVLAGLLAANGLKDKHSTKDDDE
jgi:hypothetical protein